MPFKYQLTWISQAKRWRKRYQGNTYFLRTPSNGKRDRAGYESALKEWERLKAYLDGLGPNPYTETGALIPEEQQLEPVAVSVESEPVTHSGEASPIVEFVPQPKPDNPFLLGTGLYPEQVIHAHSPSLLVGERRVETLAKAWLDRRRLSAERGELSFKQWAEDQAKLEVFRKFLQTNFPTLRNVDQVTPLVLNLYRDKQWEFVDWPTKEHRISKATLKKRLDTVSKWLHWLVDQNVLTELPKDLKTYGRVKLDKPKPIFWEVADVKLLSTKAVRRTRLFIMLGLNLGATQKDIATLTPDMIDWETGIVTRDRHKTGVFSKAKLWPSTLALLKKYRNPVPSGPLLVGQNGLPLYAETINENGKLVVNDVVRLSFDRLKNAKKTGFKGDPRSFKHLRKTAANEIERVRPDLTELFLAHSEGGMKRAYVERHFQELYAETDKLETLFGFAS